jgi:prepilin-type N-terminal cleavage/methylation domain-containing protein
MAASNGKYRLMKRGFTVVELLIVIAIIAIFAALLLPVLSHAKATTKRTVCMNNLHQIDVAMLMYVDDHADAITAITNKEPIGFSYKISVLPYLSRNGSSTNDILFTCPADDFDCTMPAIQDLFLFDNVTGRGFCHLKETYYSSYFFNGEAAGGDETRMAGKPFSSVRDSSRRILLGELSAAAGLSAHDRKEPNQFNNARNVLAFVDGHASFVPIYWNGNTGYYGLPGLYNPPIGYEYTWFGN